tara:strand:+ start:260 stop:706 length:447 start_codon:yes stop_codon:yes gene_type:complete
MAEVEEKIDNWKEVIEQAYEGAEMCFHQAIWEMSMNAFDIPREVQVVIDGNDKLFISVGTPSFVSFDGQTTQLKGMRIPLKSWIHTHPFGEAYFSETDLKTIDMWHRYLENAIVLGNEQKMEVHFRCGPNGENYQEFSQFRFLGDEEE